MVLFIPPSHLLGIVFLLLSLCPNPPFFSDSRVAISPSCKGIRSLPRGLVCSCTFVSFSTKKIILPGLLILPCLAQPAACSGQQNEMKNNWWKTANNLFPLTLRVYLFENGSSEHSSFFLSLLCLDLKYLTRGKRGGSSWCEQGITKHAIMVKFLDNNITQSG